MIYLDNAATTYYKPKEMTDAVLTAMQGIGNAGRGAYPASLEASRLVSGTRKELSDFFHLGNPSQVVFTANATESLNIVIQGLFHRNDHVITTAMEHNSVLRPLYLMRERGIHLTVVPADKEGRICYRDFEDAIRDNTKAIVCTHASNLTGNMTDINKIGAICRKHGILFVLDASQTAGIFDINMQQDGISILCFTGHKGLLGPQGTGGICLSEGISVSPLIVGGSGIQTYSERHPCEMPASLEAGTLNTHGIAGLHGSLSYINRVGMGFIRDTEQKLLWRLYDGLSSIQGVKIYGDFNRQDRDLVRAPIIAMNLKEYDSGEVADELYMEYGISTRAGAHCAPLMHMALGTKEQGAVRFSISHFNTEDEIEKTIEAVQKLAE